MSIVAVSAQAFGDDNRSASLLIASFLTLVATGALVVCLLLASFRGAFRVIMNIGRGDGCVFKNGIQSSRRLSSLTALRKVAILVLWAALSMPCFALDSSGLMTTDAPTNGNEPPITHLPVYNHPYLVICTVDGNILVLNARDGGLVCVFNSGVPLVGPSEPLSDQDRRIVPGLDGRLYVSSGGEDGLLEPLEITVLDVLASPVKTCKSTPSEDGTSETECGIVTATKSTSLFALDPTTGNLVWQQHPNGTTIAAPAAAPVSHTVLLQREDVLVQQISTDTGKSIWNVTLGSLQALEFGTDVGSSASSGGLPPPAQSLLPGGGRMGDRAEDLLLEDYLYELPHVVFSEDGTNVVAVDPSTSSSTNNRRRLWSREFPTVVASVFGLNGKSWEPLTVLDEGDADDGVVGEETERRLIPEPTSGLTLYRAPHMHLFAPFNVESLYHGMNWLLQNTAWTQHGRYPRPSLHFAAVPEKEQKPRHQLEQEDIASTGVGYNELLYRGLYPPRLGLPSPEYVNKSHGQSGGLFLTWPILVSMIVCFSSGAILGFRYLYMKKKKRWLGLLSAAVTSGGRNVSFLQVNASHRVIGGHRRSGSDGSNNARCEKESSKLLIRSHSVPGKLDHLFEGNKLQTAAFRGMPPTDSLPKFLTTYKSGPRGSFLAIVEKPPSATRTTTGSTEISSSQGVGLIDGSIPLIQYSRYASEFEELGALGKGGFGSVLQCRNALDGREYAIKKVHIRSDSKLPQAEFSRRLQRTLREVKSLALLDHPNIVRYYTAWLEQEQRDAADESHSVAPDSEYDIFSPTTSRGNTLGRGGKRETSRRPRVGRSSSNRRPSCERYRKGNGTNPISYDHSSSGVDDSASSSGYYANDMPGIPDALDEYGFVFDREEETLAEGAGSTGGEANKPDVTEPLKSKASGSLSQDHLRHRGISFQTTASSVDGSSTGWSRESRNQSEATREEIQDEEGTKKPADPESSTMTKYILYIQMQFCSQKTLADFLSNEEARKGPSGSITGVDIPYALNLFLQVAQGVKHVHDQGLIHRDLKPNNCFVDDAGVVKVGDFGLSRESSDNGRSEGETVLKSPPLFENGDITAGVGTRAYASPEQMKGGSEYDSSTDIYSLGIILFELCFPMYTVSSIRFC